MRHVRKIDHSRDYGTIEVPDECPDCAICGKPVFWFCEPVSWDEKDEICHASCMENKEKNYGCEETC